MAGQAALPISDTLYLKPNGVRMAWVALTYDAKGKLFSLRVGSDDGQGGVSSLRSLGVCSGNLHDLESLLQKHRSEAVLTNEDRHRIEKYCKNRNVPAIARSAFIVIRSTTKLTNKRANERSVADPNRIALNARAIALTLPHVKAAAIQKYINKTTRAVRHYLALLPTGEPRRRKHRVADGNSASAHRPLDALRHGLIGELYDAYLAVRAANDPDEVRGFKRTADATLVAAGLKPVSEREQRYIRDQIKRFARNPNAQGSLPKIDPLRDASDGEDDDYRPNLDNAAIDG